MNRTFRLLVAACAAVLALLALPAQSQSGATISFSDPNCGSWSMSGTSPNFTLTCQSLACSISADIPNPQPSQTPTLTAKCGASGSATYTWTNTAGTGCPTAASGSVSYGPLNTLGQARSGCVYKVVAVDGANGSGQATTTVTWSTGPPPPPTCNTPTIVTTPTPLTNAGGSATVSVTNCTPGATYAWSRNGAPYTSPWSTSATPPPDALPAGGTAGYTNSYQVLVCNGPTNCVVFPATPLTASVPGTGGGGGLDMTSCAAQGLTGRLYDLPYSTTSNVNADTSNVQPPGGFGNTDVIVVRFTTSANPTDLSGLQLNPTAGYPQNFKIATLSTLSTGPFACLIAPSPVAGGGVLATTKGIFPTLSFIIGGPGFGQVQLQPNTTYYMTYVNRDAYGSAQGNCPSNDCKQDIHFQN